MICYRDMTFCGSVTTHHTCGREITLEQVLEANKMGLPIAYSYFCGDDDE